MWVADLASGCSGGGGADYSELVFRRDRSLPLRIDGLGDESVAGTEQRCKGNNAHYDAPKHTGALFLNCRLEHDDLLLIIYRRS